MAIKYTTYNRSLRRIQRKFNPTVSQIVHATITLAEYKTAYKAAALERDQAVERAFVKWQWAS